jgi:hypothetical protein
MPKITDEKSKKAALQAIKAKLQQQLEPATESPSHEANVYGKIDEHVKTGGYLKFHK